ncbi:hypothetical protein CQW49_19560 [Methylosinus trichosporium OB3b]|uniref:Uncharacterized protein n=1 Tax=Methylosinus trichosporium (strain ATCC 35070 / NCIMB 11131 / UNIQEM 75 / OB3b) TaxID=595536 RepID=A0A2D2D4E3_METT3|nr:hypothetical protein CQW49_19560 [Methylosinus trichosporium OB3b]OBS52366.1 hypothetical protein A8B73_10900 [Methylosinus sp. 3S-1]
MTAETARGASSAAFKVEAIGNFYRGRARSRSRWRRGPSGAGIDSAPETDFRSNGIVRSI